MTDSDGGNRFYHQFASWWPLISPVAEYEEEARFVATLLHSTRLPVREVLELGSGGGHNAAHLKQHFRLTLVDLSPQMLEVSRRLNPECDHATGDMRTVRLARTFDAVFVHDAVNYMTTEDDLRRAIETAYRHCRPGGLVVLLPDHTRETFAAGTDHGGTDGHDGRGVRFLQWSWDPDPSDSWVLTEYAFVFRHADGVVESAHERHRTGLFGRDIWLWLLAEAGFEPSAVTEETHEDRSPRTAFIGYRPRGDGAGGQRTDGAGGSRADGAGVLD
jgi:SAM-dependent methyltransferase